MQFAIHVNAIVWHMQSATRLYATGKETKLCVRHVIIHVTPD